MSIYNFFIIFNKILLNIIIYQRKMEREAKEREQLAERYEDCDGRFAFIAGYTDGGAPYGVMWEEVGIDPGLPFEEKVKLYHMQVLD